MDYTHYQDELLKKMANGDKIKPIDIFDAKTVEEFAALKAEPLVWGFILTTLDQQGIRSTRVEQIVADVQKRTNGSGRPGTGLLPPETLTHLIADNIPAPLNLFGGLMHEGMLLFAGKSKRGKSWLIFDLAISLAVG